MYILAIMVVAYGLLLGCLVSVATKRWLLSGSPGWGRIVAISLGVAVLVGLVHLGLLYWGVGRDLFSSEHVPEDPGDIGGVVAAAVIWFFGATRLSPLIGVSAGVGYLVVAYTHLRKLRRR